jgi:hypothetical protein
VSPSSDTKTQAARRLCLGARVAQGQAYLSAWASNMSPAKCGRGDEKGVRGSLWLMTAALPSHLLVSWLLPGQCLVPHSLLQPGEPDLFWLAPLTPQQTNLSLPVTLGPPW